MVGPTVEWWVSNTLITLLCDCCCSASVMGEWDNWGKSPSPASLYLEYAKLQGWLVSSQRVLEAVAACQKILRSYLREEKEDLVGKLTGKATP